MDQEDAKRELFILLDALHAQNPDLDSDDVLDDPEWYDSYKWPDEQ